MNGNDEMSSSDFQMAQVQATLLELTKKNAELNEEVKSLSLDIEKGQERIKSENEQMKKSISTLNDNVNNLMVWVKYWKFAFGFLFAVGALIVSLVEFSNEIVTFLKSMGKMKGGSE